MKTKILIALILLAIIAEGLAIKQEYPGYTVDTSNNGVGMRNTNNQLYIYGAVSSDNTIGGASKNPYLCPYDVKCDYTKSVDGKNVYDQEKNAEIAKRYDRSYFRSFHKLKGADENGNAVYSGNPSQYRDASGRIDNNPLIIKYDPRLIQAPPPGFEGAM